MGGLQYNLNSHITFNDVFSMSYADMTYVSTSVLSYTLGTLKKQN